MKKTAFLLALVFMLSVFAPASFASDTGTYKVQIIVEDPSGSIADMSNAMSLISCESAITWGKGWQVGGYGLFNILYVNPTTEYYEFYTNSYEDITFNLSNDNGDYAYYISDTVKKEELRSDSPILKVYKISDLKKLDIKTSFINKTGGKYEVSVVNPSSFNYESDNQCSTFTMKPDGSKELYISPGSFNFIFKYVDQGVCALTYRENVNTSAVRQVQVSKDNVTLTKYSYKSSKALEEYNYYIMHTNLFNGSYRAYLKGLFDEKNTLDYYMDVRIPRESQQIIFSKYPDNEYQSSVWPVYQNKIPIKLGNSFSPGEINMFTTYDGRQSIEIFFSDNHNNSVRFIDLSGEKDTVIQIFDKKTGEKIYENTVSRYWDYFEPNLAEGSYLAKIYPVEKANGIDSCTYYDLQAGSVYKFTKLFSKKLN